MNNTYGLTDFSVRDWYYRRILHNLPGMLARFDGQAGTFVAPSGPGCLIFGGLRPLAFLYSHKLPNNPYYHDASILDKVLRAGDAICAGARPTIHGTLNGEWPAYNLVESVAWLRAELGPERVECWRQSVSEHLDIMGRSNNYITTAPNHFLWRVALFQRAGEVFAQPDWLKFARILAHQVCGMQTPDGYWEEAHRAHGPSTAYHLKALHALDLYYRMSGDEIVRPALDKAIEFTIRSAYPDGIPVETFDGRQSYLYSFTCSTGAGALSRTPRGRRLLQLTLQRMDELGAGDFFHARGFLHLAEAFGLTDFMVDSFRFCEDGPVELLPQEGAAHEDAFVLTGVSPQGPSNGIVSRRGPWFLALSAAESDVPRFIENVFITERQSGISIWHAEAGLVVGGGNRGRGASTQAGSGPRQYVPLANAIVLTGWQGVKACPGGVFSEPAGEARIAGIGKEATNPLTGCYHPIRRRAETRPDGARLWLDFMHARIHLDLIVLAAGKLRLQAAYESAGAGPILLQVPIPLFAPDDFELDGAALKLGSPREVKSVPCRHQIVLNARGHTVSYRLPHEAEAIFTYPLDTVRNWRLEGLNYERDAVYQPRYSVGLLSRQFDAPCAEVTLLEIDVQ